MERARQPVATAESPGLIGVLTQEGSRYTRFWISLLGSHRDSRVRIEIKVGVNIAEARNEVLETAEKIGAPWVWFLDDDHVWDPMLLQRLLAREVDVIQPVVLVKQYPFGPVHMGPPTPEGKYWRYVMMPGQSGLVECHAVGAAGMLLRRPVWQAIPPPWFEVGRIDSAQLGEDITFCLKVRKAGFKVWCDLDHPLGHLLAACITPRRKPDGTWYTELAMGQSLMEIPAAEPLHMIDDKGNIVASAPVGNTGVGGEV